ncbi:MAG: glycine--tRNA ligase [Thermoplasmata archaeon]|nr:glycine--tRNA ligase [Thermoplasmata archaeon]
MWPRSWPSGSPSLSALGRTRCSAGGRTSRCSSGSKCGCCSGRTTRCSTRRRSGGSSSSPTLRVPVPGRLRPPVRLARRAGAGSAHRGRARTAARVPAPAGRPGLPDRGTRDRTRYGPSRALPIDRGRFRLKSDELYALLRRRGVLWPSAEIYGGSAGLYDYGPAGRLLKRKIEDAWASWFVGLSDDYHQILPSEILPEPVVRASGHLENFTDPEVTCDACHTAFRADTVLEKVRPEGVDGLAPNEIADLLRTQKVTCPKCGASGFSVPQPFNLMFSIDLGVTGGERGYLAPETAQGSFLSFPRMYEVGRKALPLGIAVVARAYRNEIAPRQVLFRLRAFTQAELQIFFDPTSFPVPIDAVADERLPVVRAERRAAGDESIVWTSARELVDLGGLPAFYVFHLAHTYRFYRDVLGHPAEAIRLFEKSAAERAFYNRIQFDVEVRLESLGGFRELGAVHYRGDYDLTRHAEGSGKDLTVLTTDGRRLLPHVLELTFGVDRNLWGLSDSGLVRDGERTLWRLRPYLAPYPVAVLPLLKKELGPAAAEVLERLRAAGIPAVLDIAGSIGRRYARQDEIGTPFAITIDGETIDPAHPNHGTVTLRERDSKSQERLPTDRLVGRIAPTLLFPRPPAAPAASVGGD